MQIVFATDKSYWIPTYVTIQSLLEHNTQFRMHIIVLCIARNRFFDRNLWRLQAINPQATIEVMPITHHLDKLNGLKTVHHLTSGTYFRFLIDEFVPEDWEKVLYLDSDILVMDSLKPLYDTVLDDKLLGVVPTVRPADATRLGLADDVYFNAGVLLINLDEWRSASIAEQLFRNASNNREVIKWPSQDPINVIADGRLVHIDERYNFDGNRMQRFSRDMPDKTPAILHFTGSTKPWHRVRHQFDVVYRQALKKAPIGRVRPVWWRARKRIVTFPRRLRKIFSTDRKAFFGF